MLKYIFFDMGNTLLHFHKGLLNDEEKDFLGLSKMYPILKKLDPSFSFEILLEFYHNWIDTLAKKRKFSAVEFKIGDFLKPLLSEKIQKHYCYDLEKELLLAFQGPTIRFTEAEQNLRQTLSILKNKGYQLGVISNTPVPGFCHLEAFKHHQIHELFSSFCFSYDVNYRKPDSKIFKYALNKIKALPEETVFIGDKLNLDIYPALDYGLKAVWYNQENIHENEDLSNFPGYLGKIETFAELIEIL